MAAGPRRVADPGSFSFYFPTDAIVCDCDLAGPAVTAPEAQELVDFPTLQPAELPAGLEVHKVLLGGDLNFAFGFTLICWSVDTTALTLIGNLPYPELLTINGSGADAKPTLPVKQARSYSAASR